MILIWNVSEEKIACTKPKGCFYCCVTMSANGSSSNH